MFHDLRLPRIFSGNTPVLVVLLLAVFTVIGVQAFSKTPLMPDWPRIGIGAGVVLVLSIILGIWLRRVADRQLQAAFVPLRIALDDANHASKAMHDREVAAQEKRLKEAGEKFDVEISVAKDKRVPLLANANRTRDAALVQAKADQAKQIGFVEAKRNRATAEAAKILTDRKEHLDAELKKEVETNHAKANARLAEYSAIYEKEFGDLKGRWTNGLAEIQKPIHGATGGALLPWEEEAWKDWKPPKQFPALVRFGELRVDLRQITDKVPQKLELPATFSVPGALAFPEHGSLLINTDQAGRPDALRALHNLIVRLMTTLPPGRAKFTFIDPIGLGKNFAGFMHLADYDEALVGGRIWVDSEQIDRQLTDLAEHMETVIQKYLRNEFETIDDYNAQAGELAEPYRFLVIADLPVNFSPDAMRRLASIVSSGPRCGVYVLCMRDTRQPLPQGSHLDELEAHSVNLVRQGDRFVWADEVFRQFPLYLDQPPADEFLTKLLNVVGQAAKESKRVEVSFDTIAPPPDKLWSMSTKDELSVPVGRLGATRLQMLKLGRGVAQHVLIAGKTGSGKSTLLHALVTNLSMWYSPEEVEFYLVDFKKGVEFKTYATHHLPHARAIAVESDREFGLSVLQRLDAELTRRGNLYRKLGVQDLPAFRAQSPGVPMPRTLLIIDEFQEFFSEDDKLSQEAQLLLDRLVRQGRAFGIHVLLGSQTIGGSSGLARTTIGQMAVRVALQTSEADSHLILGDNNAAARLLTRPGEAIYNDQGGLVEGNSPFQIAWLPDEKREQYLERVRQKALNAKMETDGAIVFEGNAPADILKNTKLEKMLTQPTVNNQQSSAVAFLGEPVAIKEPTGVVFRRQSGSNMLVIGQQEESAAAIVAMSMISLAAQQPEATFYLMDGTAADSLLAGFMGRAAAVLPNEVKTIDYRAVPEAMGELSAELKKRQETEHQLPAIYVVIFALQRYRVLRKSDDGGFSFSSTDEEKPAAVDKQFADLLREGPPLGMHVISWADTPAAVDRTLERSSMREFDNRILFQMSATDSSNLIDSPAGNKLGFHRALAYSEEQGVMEKFRPYALPDSGWLEHVREVTCSTSSLNKWLCRSHRSGAGPCRSGVTRSVASYSRSINILRGSCSRTSAPDRHCPAPSHAADSRC